MKKTVIVTGGNSGLGYETALTLASDPALQVIIASRSKDRTTTAAQALTKATGQEVIPMQLDLASFASVRQFVSDFQARALPPLHSIVCNAGLTGRDLQYTQDGIEQLFGINHLGHFLLVNLLLPMLQEPGRIVFVSSGTHEPDRRMPRLMGVPAPKYINAMALAYPEKAAPEDAITIGFQRYSTSKLCNILCAYELSRRLEDRNIGVFAFDPGFMPDTMFTRILPFPIRQIFREFFLGMRLFTDHIRSMKDSGKHLARLITDPALNGRTGLYFDGLKEAPSSDESYDLAKAHDLWETSAHLTGLSEVQITTIPA